MSKVEFEFFVQKNTSNGLFTLDDTENDTDTDTEYDNYGFHYNMQSTSHCTETLPLMPLASFSHFIGLATYIVLGVAQCEHIITLFNRYCTRFNSISFNYRPDYG